MFGNRSKRWQRMVCASLLAVFIFSPVSTQLAEAVKLYHPILYLFWGQDCPHCKKEKAFLEHLREKYPQLEIRSFETWKHPELRQLAEAMRQSYGVKTASVPMTFIGNWTTTGFDTAETTGSAIEQHVQACIEEGCIDPLDKLGPRQIVLDIRDQMAEDAVTNWKWYPAADPFTLSQSGPTMNSSASVSAEKEAEANAVRVPLLGNISVTQTGLPLFTIIIGGLDGFNPCAMWVLCFLLTLVIYAKSRARILLIGGIFVVASGVIYFFFMAAWLNLFLWVGYVKVLRIAVALVAIVMGLINCKDFFFFKQGFSLTIPESAQPRLFKRMRGVIQASAIPAVILGTIVLAVTANLIELLCTAGFPAIYTRILTLQNLSTSQYYLYLAFYNVVYVIPLAVIVSIFAWKMGGRKLSEKEGRILKLVGGVLMLALGLILLLRPQLLMFG